MGRGNSLRAGLVLPCTLFCIYCLASQEFFPQESKLKQASSERYLYSPDSGSRLESSTRISGYEKLLDDKNYEIRTTYQTPSINGGEKVDREISEKSQKVSETQFKVERVVRTADTNGRLSPFEVVNEEHHVQGAVEEIQRSFFRPDINGKLEAQTVENEVITIISKKEKQNTRALYRPSIEGKFSLAELEEGSERKISDNISLKESTRKLKDPNGRLATIETLKETTSKLSEKSFKKESVVQQADENGRLAVTDKVVETQSENPDGTRKYERILESRNINPQIRNVNTRGLTLSQRVTSEEKRLPDGAIENLTKVETLDPLDQSRGLKLTEIVTETSKPIGNGKVAVERVVKTRDVNGNYIVSLRVAETLEQKK
jgi:hypothetical protein